MIRLELNRSCRWVTTSTGRTAHIVQCVGAKRLMRWLSYAAWWLSYSDDAALKLRADGSCQPVYSLRNRFSAKMHTPGATPYIDHPVPADEFLDAAIQLGKNEPITNARIKAVPDRPQQVLTIGLVQKFVNAAFVKIGRLREEIDYQLRTAAAAFDAHSRAKLNQALAKRESVAT